MGGNMELLVGLGFIVIIILNLTFLKTYKERSNNKLLLTLKTNEQYYHSLYQYHPDLTISFDMEGNLISVNKVVESYGYTEEEVLNQSFLPYVAPNQVEKTLQHFQIAKSGKSTNYETSIYSRNGDQIELGVTNIPIVVDNQIVGVFGHFKDITELKRTQHALVEAEAKYRNLSEDAMVGNYIIQDVKFAYVNRRLLEMLGCKEEEMIGMNIMEFVHPEDRVMVTENMNKRLLGGVSSIQYQYRAIKKDQTIMHMEVHGSITVYQGKPAIFGTVIDITARKEAEETIEYMTNHDALTGLPNRYQFYNRLQTAIGKETTDTMAVLFFDLDRFQVINDSMGHVIGDRLLQLVSERIKSCVNTKEDLARNGGDEFLISLLNKNRQEVSAVANQVLDCFVKPFQIDQYELYITPSIGISLYPSDGKDIETLIKKADLAMYQAKAKGKNSFEYYLSRQVENTYERLEIDADLRKAIEQNEFQVHYQPKINLTSGKITGVEALLRWQHPEKGLVQPSEFIPHAEETGLILPMGEWVLHASCKQNMSWQEAGLPPMVMSVNLSVRQLYQPNLVERVREILDETGLAPEYLELEITESMLMDIQHSIKVLKELKSIGLQISMDDFGTGYSSLHYLKELPIDKLKIDQSFVFNCTEDANDATIVKTIIAMAHELKLKVVAEGVEEKEHLLFLQRNLCDEAQGYLFSKPLPQAEFVQKFEDIENMIARNGLPQELTNQKWMEEALKVARQELVDTVRQQQGMIFKFVERDGKFIHTLCDGELLYRMNLIPEQIIGRELSDFLPLKIAQEINRDYQRAWNGEADITYESTINDIYYECSLRAIRRGGKVVEVIGSCVDITDRKRVEEALKLSEANYRLITENMLDMIRVLDEDGIVKYASPSHETVLGFSPEEYVGKRIFDMVHPDDIPHVQKTFANLLTTNTASQFEFRVKHASGGWVHVESQGTPVLSENDEVKYIIVMARDISERKKIDELIRKTDKLSVVGQLAAGVAHEIRNPLTSVKGLLQIMQVEVDKPNYIDIMLSEIDGVEKIVKEFLSLAKPQVSKISPININVLVEHVVTLISAQVILKNIEIVQEMEDDLPQLQCDENQIKQVFINILRNAVEAMESGGVIKIQAMSCDTDKVKFRFIDQGCGIPVERIKSIGEPFYSTKEKGTGLGLMISHKIIQEHEGSFHIESVVDQGTTVEIVLPVEQSVFSGIDKPVLHQS